MTERPDDDVVPVSVRLGEVVPPEDPEDWTKPLTWVAAAGMLAAPALTLAWFAVAPPADGTPAVGGTWLVAAALAGGAVLTGATQQGALQASTATMAAALFAALVVIVIGVAMAGERQVGAASPTLAHAFGAAVAGLAGALAASALAAVLARVGAFWLRLLAPGAVGVVVGLLLLGVLMGTAAPL
ncbi:MAG TPA: hypothetical protein VH859_06015 [Candidatus Limnocylindria bacterium]|jgi:hypothetical protein